MWYIILLIGAFTVDYISAEEIEHGNYLLNIDDGILRSIKATNNTPHLDLSGLKLKKIEEKVFDNLSGVQRLNLDNNQLENLPALIFSKLDQLETLSLADNKISELEDNIFVGLDKLKCLNVSNNAFRQLEDGVFYGLTKSVDVITEGNALHSISTRVFMDPASREPYKERMEPPRRTELPEEPTTTEIPPVLDANLLVKICKTADGIVNSVEERKKDEALADCTSAVVNHEERELSLSGLGLKKFQKDWYKLSAFPFLSIDFSENDITDITPELLNDLPKGLTEVYLRKNKIQTIKKDVIANDHLKTIVIADNFISTIEDGALEKTKLTNLAASTNRLKSLSFAKTLPSTLQVLTANQNAIDDIPEDSMKNLKDLLYVNLAFNNVSDLPANALRDLKNLNTLDLSYNQLSEIHPGTFEDLEKLITLRLAHNGIVTVNFGCFRGLNVIKSLHLNNNKIKKISRDSFSDLTGKLGVFIYLYENEIEIIEEGSFTDVAVLNLFLHDNKIATIPPGAFNASLLTSLYLENNMFTTIDGDSFSGLPHLLKLRLSGNKITSIKKGAAKNLGNLQELDISNNPLERLENGALYGLGTQSGFVSIADTPIKILQGGAFADV
ncbi:protein artichoke-like [Diachasmimorpha longicaudata]|uniref:protein artichoke-like n=1 Tax=Diachasmimorpha longicaudata TaxID=58733 RepID=UPI0030B8FE25